MVCPLLGTPKSFVFLQDGTVCGTMLMPNCCTCVQFLHKVRTLFSRHAQRRHAQLMLQRFVSVSRSVPTSQNEHTERIMFNELLESSQSALHSAPSSFLLGISIQVKIFVQELCANATIWHGYGTHTAV